MRETEIRGLEVDFDREILRINGTDTTDRPFIVTLPGPEGWPLYKLLNPQLAIGHKKECDRLTVIYERGICQ